MEKIRKYEAMAKLDLPDAERDDISGIADKLIKSFDALREIDAAQVQPMYTVLDVHNVLREDIHVKMLSREELMANAPMQSDGFFQVPKTIV